jgi:hypothetical protein
MCDNNVKTEGVRPRLWAYGHIDWKYIKGTHRLFGTEKLKTFPHFTLSTFLWYTLVKKVKMKSILNYMEYHKDEAMKVLLEELDWKYYGGKYYESNYTKYFQGIILPEKFHIDKRKLHLSALVLCGQMTRYDALKELEKPIYPVDKITEDTDYVIKKFGIEAKKHGVIMQDNPKSFLAYSSNYKILRRLRSILAILRKKKIYYS